MARSTATPVLPIPAPPTITGWDSVEWWVGNARSSTAFWMSCFGFECVAYAGPETGVRDRVSYVLRQGQATFVISAALSANTPMAIHHVKHGDGVKDLAFEVADVTCAYEAAIARGAVSVREPWTETDESGTIHQAQVATYGETTHTFVDRRNYRGVFAPGYVADRLPPSSPGSSVNIEKFDHIVGNVEEGAMVGWVDFYHRVFGFEALVQFDENQIATEYSALRSTVVSNGSSVFMPINEPALGRKKSQIQEYLDEYGMPGVQHIAFRTRNIAATVAALRDRGLRFMEVPEAYYDEAQKRMAGIDLPWEKLRAYNILVDRDASGYLLQIFTETVTDRPTVFCEIIERHDAAGFGEGNFKALFQAIERDQDKRGNL
jgi:4-hydroxyphenylpyruvate dioxygenase